MNHKRNTRVLFSAAAITILTLRAPALAGATTDGAVCQTVFASPKDLRRAALPAAQMFNQYFAWVDSNILERGFLRELAQTAILAEMPLTISGASGTGKTKFIQLVTQGLPSAKPFLVEASKKDLSQSHRAERAGLLAFVPSEFELTASYVGLMKPSVPSQPAPAIDVPAIKALRDLKSQVEISEPIARAIVLLSARFKSETDKHQASDSSYQVTRRQSPLLAPKLKDYLTAVVVRDWAAKSGKRKLEIEFKDLAALEQILTFNGPSDDFLQSELARTSDKREQSEIKIVLDEREMFRRIYKDLAVAVENASLDYDLQELTRLSAAPKDAAAKKHVVERLTAVMVKLSNDRSFVRLRRDLNEEEVARELVGLTIESSLARLIGPKEVAALKVAAIEDIERAKKAQALKIELAEREKRERLASERREEARKLAKIAQEKAAAEKRAAELVARFSDPTKYEVATFNIDLGYSESALSVAYDETSKKLAIYDVYSDNVLVINTADKKPVAEIASIGDLLSDERSNLGTFNQIYFESANRLRLFNDGGTATVTYNTEFKTADSEPLAVKASAVTFDVKNRRSLSFDAATFKLKFVTETGSTANQLRFVPNGHWDETDIRNLLNDGVPLLKMSDDATYAVLLGGYEREVILKIDLAENTLTPIRYERLRDRTVHERADRSIVHGNDDNVVALDVSGREPLVRVLKMASEDDNADGERHFEYGATHVAGTPLVLIGADRGRGPIAVNGETGFVAMVDVFGLKDLDARSSDIFPIANGYVVFSGNYRSKIHFIKFKSDK